MPNTPRLPNPITTKTYGGGDGLVFLTTKQYNFMIKKMKEDRHKVVLLTAKHVYYRKKIGNKIKEIDLLIERLTK